MDRQSVSGVTSAEPVDGVHLRLLAAGERMNIQHFKIEPGATVPEHSHPHEQLGYVTSGTLTFELEGAQIEISAGDAYSLAGDEPHAAVNEGDTVVEGIDIFSPPRTDPDWAD
jgi:quercetin dioxygenase-like cupin family protein